MDFIETNLEGLYLVKHLVHQDGRGAFFRSFCKRDFSKIGFRKEFVQFNHSFNIKKGTFRGLHYQLPPFSEYKLIRCVSGRVLDIAVDLRKNSSTFLEHFTVELNTDNMQSILIPEGFAHGFLTLEDNSALIYHHTEFYNPIADQGLKYDDPKLAIDLPLTITNISEKDESYKYLNNTFEGLE